MPTWVLILLFVFLVLALGNGWNGVYVEWPVMPLRKRVVSVVFILIWAGITLRVAAALLDRIL